ncbi:MAG: hypothetical protein R6U32_00445 [Candidatus Woesearchaeota archaeon]
MEKIQYIGVEDLSKEEKEGLDRLSAEYYDKIQRELQNITSLKVHVKRESKGGSPRYEVKAIVAAPTRTLQAEDSDWDLPRTLHKVFKDMVRQLEHRFKD